MTAAGAAPASADLVEIFSGIQGEGGCCGARQVFVRTWGCNLKCHYCDTPSFAVPGPTARLEQTPGRRNFRAAPNPVAAEEALAAILALGPTVHHSLSFTGGEPLLREQFLAALWPRLKEVGGRIYLETNGTMPRVLERLLPWVDIISMDLKPPSSTADIAVWDKHWEFLAIARQKELYLKIIVTPDTSTEEFEFAVRRVAQMDRRLPLFLQPVTPYGPVTAAPTFQQIYAWQDLAARHLDTVRMIPQVHKLLGDL